MPRNTSGLTRTGRKPGQVNKTTADVRDIAQKLISSPAYVEALNIRLEKGSAGAVEPLLWHYAYGKPMDTTAHVGPNGGVLTLQVTHVHESDK